MLTETFQKLRLSDAFKYKVPVLITSVYAVVWMYAIAPATAYFYLFLSIITITGIAGYAYLLNDWSDEQKDRISGKKNATSGLSVIQKWGLLWLFGALAIVPWFYFPTTSFTLSLLVLELALFAAYSLPPLRLKERPIAGVVVDALYAHVVPVVLATATFGLLPSGATRAGAINITLLFMVTHWQFFNGIRNILLHEEEDRDKDLQSNTTTFATAYTLDITSSVIEAAFKLEILCLAFVLYVGPSPLASGWLLAYGMFLISLFAQMGLKMFSAANFRTAVYRFADDFYNLWFPLPVLALLCYQNTNYVFLLAMHLLLLPNPIKRFISERLFNK